jgi:hypothetical protein
MRIPRLVAVGLLARRLTRTLEAIDRHLVDQNVLLTRLVDHLAPVPPPGEDVRTASAIDYLNQTEAGLVLSYIERTVHELGRQPTEDEILAYLADEATTDLQARLAGADPRAV